MRQSHVPSFNALRAWLGSQTSRNCVALTGSAPLQTPPDAVSQRDRVAPTSAPTPSFGSRSTQLQIAKMARAQMETVTLAAIEWPLANSTLVIQVTLCTKRLQPSIAREGLVQPMTSTRVASSKQGALFSLAQVVGLQRRTSTTELAQERPAPTPTPEDVATGRATRMRRRPPWHTRLPLQVLVSNPTKRKRLRALGLAACTTSALRSWSCFSQRC